MDYLYDKYICLGSGKFVIHIICSDNYLKLLSVGTLCLTINWYIKINK